MLFGQHEDTLGVSQDMNKLHDRIQHLGDGLVNNDIGETIQRHIRYEQPGLFVSDRQSIADYLDRDRDYEMPVYRHIPEDLVARPNLYDNSVTGYRIDGGYYEGSNQIYQPSQYIQRQPTREIIEVEKPIYIQGPVETEIIEVERPIYIE